MLPDMAIRMATGAGASPLARNTRSGRGDFLHWETASGRATRPRERKTAGRVSVRYCGVAGFPVTGANQDSKPLSGASRVPIENIVIAMRLSLNFRGGTQAGFA